MLFAIPQPRIAKRPAAGPQPGNTRAPQSNFKQKLQSGDLDACLSIVKNRKDKSAVSDVSQLIEKLIHKERLLDATKLTVDLLDKGNFPVNKIFR